MRIDYALSAVFDINLGAKIDAQFPESNDPIFDNALAELLIPDGVHQYHEDWCYFSLWKDTPDKPLSFIPRKSDSQKFFVCDYIRSVFDKDIKRGARIVTLAIITSDPAYACLKPILTTSLTHALDLSTKGVIDAKRLTKMVYDVISSIDTSGIPRYSWYEKRLLDTTIPTSADEYGMRSAVNEEALQALPSLSELETLAGSSHTGETSNNGSSLSGESKNAQDDGDKSRIAEKERLPGIETDETKLEDVVKETLPLTDLALIYADEEGSSEMNDLFAKSSAGDEKRAAMVAQLRASDDKMDKHFVKIEVKIPDVEKPVLIYVPTFVDTYSAGSFSVTRVLRSLFSGYKILDYDKRIMPLAGHTPPLIPLWLSAIAGRRVLIYRHPSTAPGRQLCETVQACGYLTSAEGLLDTHRRTFPHVNLHFVADLQEIARKEGGFFAGTTNEAFLLHPEWWDILIRPDTKEVRVSKTIAQHLTALEYTRRAIIPSDLAFFKKIVPLSAEWYNETKLRLLCCVKFEELLHKCRDISKNVPQQDQKLFTRLYGSAGETWKTTKGYQTYLERVQDEAKLANTVYHIIQGNGDIPELYKSLSSQLTSDSAVTRLFLIPDSVYYVSLGLFHRNQATREIAWKLLDVIEHHPHGSYFINALPLIHLRGRDMVGKSMALTTAHEDIDPIDELDRLLLSDDPDYLLTTGANTDADDSPEPNRARAEIDRGLVSSDLSEIVSDDSIGSIDP